MRRRDRSPAREGPGDPAGPLTDAAAVVLAGGASRRMGRPKAFLSVGGRELLEVALDAAASACPAIVLVADPSSCADALRRYGWAPRTRGEERLYDRGPTRLRLLTDRRPGQGPLAGLETAWAESGGGNGLWPDGRSPARWWGLAADLPFVSGEVGRRLLEELRAWESEAPAAADEPPARAVVPVSGGRPQPLCAAYGAGLRPVASRCLDAGHRAMGAFLDRLQVRHLALESDLASRLDNVNTPEELARAHERAMRERTARGR